MPLAVAVTLAVPVALMVAGLAAQDRRRPARRRGECDQAPRHGLDRVVGGDRHDQRGREGRARGCTGRFPR